MKTIAPSWPCALLLLLSSISSFAAAPAQPEFTVMSCNIGCAAGIPLGPEQINQIADQIAAERVDFAGLQEVDFGTDRHGGRDFAAEIAVALAARRWPMFHYYTPTIPYPGGDMGLALFSRYPITASDYRVTVDIAAEKWKAARISVRLPDTRTLNIFTTHYWIGDGSRHPHQTETIIDFLRDTAGPKIVTGDFNLTPDHPCFQQLLDSGLQEACLIVNATHCATVGTGAGVVAPERVKQIDYIFATPDLTFTKSLVPSSTVSDHWPLVATVTMKH